MTLKDEVSSSVATILSTPFDKRTGTSVPTTATVKLKDGAVLLDAVYLYADMADSTGLAKNHPKETVAKVVRSYLSSATRAVLRRGGEIRSFDGDRVMAIFKSDTAADDAARAALELKWLVANIVQPKIKASFKSIQNSGWVLRSGVGIDAGQALIVRGGVRDNNDLVSIRGRS